MRDKAELMKNAKIEEKDYEVLDIAPQSNGFYTSKKAKLLADYIKTANLVGDFVESIYGEELAATLQREALREYEKLIPDIPHLKGRLAGQLNSFLMITAQEVALWKVMKKHDLTPAEAWEICHEAITRRMKNFSKIKRWLLQQTMYSGIAIRRMKKRAEARMHLRFGDFEVRYVIGDGKEFDYEVDYVACGNYKFALDQGVEEFAPYICMSDICAGQSTGMGFN